MLLYFPKYWRGNFGPSRVSQMHPCSHQLTSYQSSFMLIFLGWILIDRCGKHFGIILNFLRDGTVALPETRRELQELQQEAKYYLIQVIWSA